jgi:hypothetical protein
MMSKLAYWQEVENAGCFARGWSLVIWTTAPSLAGFLLNT